MSIAKINTINLIVAYNKEIEFQKPLGVWTRRETISIYAFKGLLYSFMPLSW